jgi:hypothetical protein
MVLVATFEASYAILAHTIPIPRITKNMITGNGF